MSGILLPGQENKPEGEAKIELPSGYKAPKKETPKEEPQKSQEESSQQQEHRVAEKDLQQAAASGEAPDLLFPPQGAQVQCPSCGEPYVVPVFSIVDLGANPELRSPLMGGQINFGICQSCGTGGSLSAPLMVHDPENQFLGVYVPMQAASEDVQQQKVIGDLTRRLMAKVPKEQQKGYMLQAQTFMDMQRMMEKLWEFEGVTPEMLKKQRDQSTLIQQLLTLVNDDSAFDMALERKMNLVDRDLFTMIDQIIIMARSQAADTEEFEKLRQLREKLVERTPAGQEVKQQAERIQAMLNRVSEDSSREDLLEIALEAWQDEDGDRLVGTFAMATGISADYEFLMLIAQRIDSAESDEEKETLQELRQFLISIQEQLNEQQRQEQEAVSQNAQQLMQEVLQAEDIEAALRERVNELDESFLATLADNIRRMEEAGSKGAAQRLIQVYQKALTVLQDQMPPDMQLLNKLITAPDDATARKLLRENRELINQEFVSNLKAFEAQMRDNGRKEAADRIKSIRGQVALML